MVPSRLFTWIWRRVRKCWHCTRKRTAVGGPSACASAAGLLVGRVDGSASVSARGGGDVENAGDDEKLEEAPAPVTGILSESIAMLELVMLRAERPLPALTGRRPSFRCKRTCAHNGDGEKERDSRGYDEEIRHQDKKTASD